MTNENIPWMGPTTLRGKHVSLEPLRPEHAEALNAAAADGELWRLWYTNVPQPAEMTEYIACALAAQESGTGLAFVVRANGEIVGSTRFCNVDAKNRRIEVGYTWYAHRMQRTALNTETKLLLLSFAFESLQAIAVEFRTHWFNTRSREAIARLGAKQDGVLRNHQRQADGTLRDTVVFSIIQSEWPAVKLHLLRKLERGGNGA